MENRLDNQPYLFTLMWTDQLWRMLSLKKIERVEPINIKGLLNCWNKVENGAKNERDGGLSLLAFGVQSGRKGTGDASKTSRTTYRTLT